MRTRLPDGARNRIEAIRATGEPVSPSELAAWIGSVPAPEDGALRVLPLIDGLRGVDSTHLAHRARSWDAERLAWAAAERDRLSDWRTNIHTALQAQRFRYPVVVTNGIANLGVPHLPHVKAGVLTLAFWAAHSAAIHQTNQAAEAILDAVRLARTLDEEPVLVSWLVRASCLTIAVMGAEDVLNLAPLPSLQLATLQEAFLNADQPETLSRALITERAFGLDLFHQSPSEYVNLTQATPVTPRSDLVRATLAQTAYQAIGARGADSEHFLRTMHELIRITRMNPGQDRRNALLKLEAEFAVQASRWNRNRSRTLAESLFITPSKDRHVATLLRCAAVACAVERYRHAHLGQIPHSLGDLVPDFLPSIPLDPADDQPIRFRKRAEGYVVYGLGPDGADNQGNDVRKAGTGNKGTDVCISIGR